MKKGTELMVDEGSFVGVSISLPSSNGAMESPNDLATFVIPPAADL